MSSGFLVAMAIIVTIMGPGCGGKAPVGGAGGDAASPGADAAGRSGDAAGDGMPDGSGLDEGARETGGGDTGGNDVAPAVDAGDAGIAADATVPPTVSAQYRACVAYFRAQCNRPNVCAGGAPTADPCPTVTDACPDIEFAAGSLRTVESLLACAEAWATLPCADVAAGRIPDCAGLAGGLADGAPCSGSIQCASTYCGRGTDTQHPNCGACTSLKPLGAACGSVLECVRGLSCQNSVCSTPTPAAALGETCGGAVYCASPNVCLVAAAGGMTCQPRPVLGQVCASIITCADGSLCTDARKCEVAPANGMLCKRDAALNRFMCDGAAVCDETAAGGPTCRPRTVAGGPCTADARSLEMHECAPDLVCACVDAACATGTCVRRLQEGDACGDSAALCVPGTTCVSGRCAAMFHDFMTMRCGP